MRQLVRIVRNTSAAKRTLKMAIGAWRRPEGPGAPPFPREYARFEGKRPMPDGRIPVFWIRDATPDQLPAISRHMEENFLRDEVIASAVQLLRDPESVEDFRALWRDALEQRVTLVATTDWPGGQERLAGCNVLGVTLASDPPIQMRGEAARVVFDLMAAMTERADVFRRFAVDRYLTGLGLSVEPALRGHDVGLRLLLARDALCAALQLPLTLTLFSGAGSQAQSRRAGFHVVDELRYADWVREGHGERPLAGAVWPLAQLKAKHYEPSRPL